MANVTVIANLDTSTVQLTVSPPVTGVTATNHTIIFNRAADSLNTVSFTQGSNVAFIDSITMTMIGTAVTITPAVVALSDGSYIFTCDNGLSSNAQAVTDHFVLTVVQEGTTTTHDPTMVFNPPDGGTPDEP